MPQSVTSVVQHAAPKRWRWLALAVVLTLWGLTDVRSRARIDPTDPLAHKTDLTVYSEAGAAFFDGRNPYDVSNPRGWRYLYPPLFAILMAPLSALDSQWQAVVWYFISLGFAWGTWREAVRIWHLLFGDRITPATGEQQFSPPVWLGGLAAATLALPALNCLQRGQVGILIVYLVLLGYRLAAENRSWWGAAAGGSALAAAVAIKLTPALPAVLLVAMFFLAVWSHRWSAEPSRRFAGAFAGLAIGLLMFFFILPGMAIGNAANVTHLRTWVDRIVLHHDMGEENNAGFYSVRDQSLTNAVERLGNWLAEGIAGSRDETTRINSAHAGTVPVALPSVERSLAFARLALSALLLIGGWRAGRHGDPLDVAAVFGLAATATLLLSPLSWAHHYLIWLPGLLVVPTWLWRARRVRLAVVLAIGPCVLIIAHYALLDWAGRAGLLGLGTTAWFLAAARVAARGDLLARCRIQGSADSGHIVPPISRQAA
jgi:Glycosyltransferase family 87